MNKWKWPTISVRDFHMLIVGFLLCTTIGCLFEYFTAGGTLVLIIIVLNIGIITINLLAAGACEVEDE